MGKSCIKFEKFTYKWEEFLHKDFTCRKIYHFCYDCSGGTLDIFLFAKGKSISKCLFWKTLCLCFGGQIMSGWILRANDVIVWNRFNWLVV
jgi:hypothetical protein